MAAVLSDDGPDRRHVPDLVAERLRVVATQGLAAVAASAGFAVVDGVGVIDEGALDLGVPLLTARFVAGGRLGRGAFEGRRIGGRWFGGIGGVLLESGLEVGEASFVSLDQSPDSGLSSRRDLLPQFVRDRRVRIHAAGLAIKIRLGNLDP
jgi:hypothetical protein